MDRLGNQTSRFIRFGLSERQFGYFSLFVLVLGHSESELHSVCLVGFLTLRGKFFKVLRSFLNQLDQLGN